MKDRSTHVPLGRLAVATYTVPTDFPESDGTIQWDRTTLVLVQASAAGKTGLGYTYADSATAELIYDKLAKVVIGMDALAPPAACMQMWRQIRNLGRPGICSMAISAIDCALWDLKAKLLDCRSSPCWAKCVTGFRFTAVAASLLIRTSSSPRN